MNISKEFIIFIGVLGVLAFTNPSEEKHRKEIKSIMFSSQMEKVIDGGDKWELMGASLGMKLADGIIDQSTEVDNYILFSISKLKKGNVIKTVGYGILGNIFFTKEFKQIASTNL